MTTVGSDWIELDYWTSPSYGSYDARLRVLARSVQDIANNTSVVYFKLQKRVTGGSAYNYDSLSFRIACTDKKDYTHTATQSWTFGNVSSTSWADVGGDTSDMYWSAVRHADDGTCTFTATATGDRVLGGSFNTDISITLPTIARASAPTVTPNPVTWSNTTSNRITVNTNRKSSSFTHTVRIDVWNFDDVKNNVGTSCYWDIPYSTLASMPSDQLSFTGSIYTQTKNGNTNIGGEVRTPFTIKIDQSIEHPQISSITIEDLNEYTSAIEAEGSLIKNASHLKATIELEAMGDYTTLNMATVVCGTKTQNYPLSGTRQTIVFEYDKVPESMLTVTVSDYRGTTRMLSKSWNLVNYTDLTAVGEIHRTSETGSTVSFKLTGQCFAGSFGQATNEITVKYKSKLHSASDFPTNWTTVGTFTPSGSGATTYEYTNTLTGFDYDKQYDLIFYVEDLFTNAQTANIVLTTGIPVYGNGEDFFAVYGSLFAHDRIDPNIYWDMTNLHNYNWNGTWNGSSSTTQNYDINGKGLVFVSAFVRSSNSSGAGAVRTYVDLRSSSAKIMTLAENGNRLSSASTDVITAGATAAYYYDGTSANNRIQCYMGCTKTGSNAWAVRIMTIGCEITAV